jgi:hypothetical protein
MMNERAWEEARLVASEHPDLELRPSDGWARIPSYPLPNGVWTARVAEIAFRFPEGLPGQAPYGFWVRPFLTLASGATVQNATPAPTPFGEDWMQFSWSADPWHPGATAAAGSNMLKYVRSFSQRLAEGA